MLVKYIVYPESQPSPMHTKKVTEKKVTQKKATEVTEKKLSEREVLNQLEQLKVRKYVSLTIKTVQQVDYLDIATLLDYIRETGSAEIIGFEVLDD